MSDQINLSLRNFRSIESADIALNGITVVTGINGCGKSTISRTLYRLIRLSSDYENAIIQRSLILDSEWAKFDRILNLVLPVDIPRISFMIQENKTISSCKEKYLENVEQAIKKAESIDPENAVILLDKIKDIDITTKESTLVQVFESLKEQINQFFHLLEEQVKKRDINLLKSYIQSAFNQKFEIEKCLTATEKSVLITDWGAKTLNPLFFIEDVVYIDTPMMVGLNEMFYTPYMHWAELNKSLRRPPLEDNPYSELIDYIQTHIIHGSISKNEITKNFSFTLEDSNQSFDIEQCATGIRAFAVILLLLQNGKLNDRTLLILDEPEAHLHPEWVVEYARLLVLLHEKVKLRLFIASHDSDFVSALKNIADAKKLEKNVVNFYLAKPNDERPVRYNYTRLNNNTGPIHKEFNNAFDLTDKYCDEFESEAAK